MFAQAAGMEEMRRNLPRTPRECVTARLLLHCANRELAELGEQIAFTPHVDGIDPIASRRREVEQAFYWQMRRCEAFRSLPNIESLFSAIVTIFEQQSRRVK